MARPVLDNNERMSVRISAEDKAMIVRAAECRQTTLTEFVVNTTLAAAREVVQEAELIKLSRRDSQRVLDLLENPPKPNRRLLAAAKNLPAER